MSLSKLKSFLVIFVCSLFLLLPNRVYAEDKNTQNSNQFITIVNPVRISAYTKDSLQSLTAQYSEIKKRNMSASWLFTYDVLENQQVTDFAAQIDQQQDLGVFLEVSPKFAEIASVTYNKTDSWHRSNSVFLVGYTQEDRKKLIDTIFEKFRTSFGYYPKSVGAWWVDSFSLNYMKEKYDITATLGCADQFYTDGYSLWGQYWSTPYYPSKNHAGMPARNLENKLDLVTFQWAARDPLNGYSGERASGYSIQDYHTMGFSDDYFEKLIKLYALRNHNQFGQVTFGLEGDFSPGTYHQLYAHQLDILQKLSEQEDISITNMKDFSNWYRQIFPGLSPPHVLEADDFLGKKIKAIWYQSLSYRIGLNYDKDDLQLRVIDLRTYQDDFQEPFYLTPNTQLNLYINTPSLIDQISDPQGIWRIPTKGGLSTNGTNNKFSLYFENNPLVIFEQDKITLFDSKVPSTIKYSPTLKINELSNYIEIIPTEHWFTGAEGVTFRSLPPQFFYLLNSHNLSKQNNVKRLFIVFVILTIVFFAIYKFRLYNKKIFWPINVVIILIAILFIISQSRIYSISQAETDALLHLKSLEKGKVIVYDETCLKCVWHNQYMPAVFANIRGYVGKLTNKSIVYNRSIFAAKDRPSGKKALDKLRAKYIYLVKYENYTEFLPFSPGDYNVDLIYENANAQIWLIKSNSI